MKSDKALQVFIIYARRDATKKDEIVTHLKSLQRDKSIPKIEIWHDSEIQPGEEWDKSIKDNLINSEFILVLVSASMMSSEYINHTELKIAYKQAENKTSVLIPVEIDLCIWKDSQLGNHQCIPLSPNIGYVTALKVKDLLLKKEKTDRVNNLATNNEILNELAQELAINYYTVSFGDYYKQNETERIRKVFKKDIADKLISEKDKRRRNILIVGAGATHTSCPYIPYGVRLKKYFEEDANFGNRIKGFGIHDEDCFINNKFDPEFYLGQLDNKLGDDRHIIFDLLKELFDVKFMPTHCYGFIAHLFKHSFIDVIINFNFDELLDEAIDEVLGKDSYMKIGHDGDCKELEEIFIDGRLKTPIYIKIIGTASNRESLVFSDNRRHSPLDISKYLKNFTQKWLAGTILQPISGDENVQPDPGKAYKEEKIRVNFICLGFDPVRFNFKRFISDSKPIEGSKFFVINYNRELDDLGPEIKKMLYNESGVARHISLEQLESSYPCEIPKFGDFLYSLWSDKISNMFNPDFRLDQMHRHEITSDFFYGGIRQGKRGEFSLNIDIDNQYRYLRTYFRSANYFYDRTVFEVALLIIRNKGIVEPRESSRERVGYFYDLYMRTRSTELRQNKKNEEEVFISLQSIYKNIFKLEEKYSFGSNLFSISAFRETEICHETTETNKTNLKLISFFGHNKSECSIEEYMNRPENLHFLVAFRYFVFSGHTKNIDKLEKRYAQNGLSLWDLLTKWLRNLKGILDGHTYDIKSNFRDKDLQNYQSVERKHILHTNLALSYHYNNNLFSNEWDTLLLISERGKSLEKHRVDIKNNYDYLKGRKIIIIVCHEAVNELLNDKRYEPSPENFEKQIQEIFRTEDFIRNNINIEIWFLPYWRHHHHITIFLKNSKIESPTKAYQTSLKVSNGESLHFINSIYYFKQGFSNKVNPILFPGVAKSVLRRDILNSDLENLLTDFFAQYIKSIVYTKTGKFIPSIMPQRYYDFIVDYNKIDGQDRLDSVYQRITFNDFLKSLFHKDLNIIPEIIYG